MKIYSHEYAWSDMGDQYRQAHEVSAYPEGFRERLEGLTLEEE